ncbi:MAG: hypothetical protein M3437_09985 [Chloroflexota bacterium]|nr:hypothetical protein [Chloroflexota bacterium]MDQ5865419.1 hypothetical protein [Chloroflexota bacterium]
MSAERSRDVDSADPVADQASSCLRGCGAQVVGRLLGGLALAGTGAGMGLLIEYIGAPLTFASLFVLVVVLLEFWPRAPHPPRSPYRWLYYGPIAGLVVSLCYAAYLKVQDSEDTGWWALVAVVSLVLLGLAAKIDRWLRKVSEH